MNHISSYREYEKELRKLSIKAGKLLNITDERILEYSVTLIEEELKLLNKIYDQNKKIPILELIKSYNSNPYLTGYKTGNKFKNGWFKNEKKF